MNTKKTFIIRTEVCIKTQDGKVTVLLDSNVPNAEVGRRNAVEQQFYNADLPELNGNKEYAEVTLCRLFEAHFNKIIADSNLVSEVLPEIRER